MSSHLYLHLFKVKSQQTLRFCYFLNPSVGAAQSDNEDWRHPAMLRQPHLNKLKWYLHTSINSHQAKQTLTDCSHLTEAHTHIWLGFYSSKNMVEISSYPNSWLLLCEGFQVQHKYSVFKAPFHKCDVTFLFILNFMFGSVINISNKFHVQLYKYQLYLKLNCLDYRMYSYTQAANIYMLGQIKWFKIIMWCINISIPAWKFTLK